MTETSTANILVLLPNHLMRDLAVLGLSRQGWSVTAAQNGEEAAARLSEQTPDVMVLDLHLPGQNGIDLIRQLRLAGRLVGTRIMIVSGLALPQVVQQSLIVGACEFLTRPLDVEELIERVARQLSGGRS
jgi:DNA-binding response OmpR family regulator